MEHTTDDLCDYLLNSIGLFLSFKTHVKCLKVRDFKFKSCLVWYLRVTKFEIKKNFPGCHHPNREVEQQDLLLQEAGHNDTSTDPLQLSGNPGAVDAEQPTHGMFGLTFKPSPTRSWAACPLYRSSAAFRSARNGRCRTTYTGMIGLTFKPSPTRSWAAWLLYRSSADFWSVRNCRIQNNLNMEF